MPQITITEKLEVDGGAVTVTRYTDSQADSHMHLTIDDGGEPVSVMLSAEDARALAERILAGLPKKTVTRGNISERHQK